MLTHILIGLGAWFLLACLLGPLVGRRLRSQQPPARRGGDR